MWKFFWHKACLNCVPKYYQYIYPTLTHTECSPVFPSYKLLQESTKNGDKYSHKRNLMRLSQKIILKDCFMVMLPIWFAIISLFSLFIWPKYWYSFLNSSRQRLKDSVLHVNMELQPLISYKVIHAIYKFKEL